MAFWLLLLFLTFNVKNVYQLEKLLYVTFVWRVRRAVLTWERSRVKYLAFNAINFQSLVMPSARMSLCMQLAHSFSFPPRPLRTAPLRFPIMTRFGSRPPFIRMRVPAHKSLLERNVVSMLSHRVISRAQLYEVIRWSGLLLSTFPVVFLRPCPRFGLGWFRLFCDHDWIRSGSVNNLPHNQQQLLSCNNKKLIDVQSYESEGPFSLLN